MPVPAFGFSAGDFVNAVSEFSLQNLYEDNAYDLPKVS